MTDGWQAPPECNPPQAPTKSRAPMVALGIGIGSVLLLCACASAVLLLLSLSNCSPSKGWTLTHDQQRVMKEFGPPESFTVAFASDLETATPAGQDPPLLRLETWQYPTLGSEFSFRDGVFLSRARIAVPKSPLKTPALRPDAFVAAMSPDEVSKIVDAEPNRIAAVFPGVFKNLEVQSYRGQVIAGYQDGRLAVVQVFPVTTEGPPK